MPATARPPLPSADLARFAARIALAYAGRQEGQDSPFAELCRTAYRGLLSCAPLSRSPDALPAGVPRLPSRPSRRTRRRPHGGKPVPEGPGCGPGEFPV